MAKLLSDSSAKFLTDLMGRATSAATRVARTPFVGGSFFGHRQWHCSIADGKLRVRSGSLAWGGGHYAVWPSGRTVSRSNYSDIALTLSVGQRRFLIWYTKCAPCPLTNCPKAPNGNTTCPAAAGNPADFSADAGDIGFFDSASRGDGWTDFHVIATVERTGESDYAINQIQTAEIAVNAIVYPGEQGEESDDENAPDDTCAGGGVDDEKFPSDVDDIDPPRDAADEDDDEDVFGAENDDARFPSKTDSCW